MIPHRLPIFLIAAAFAAPGVWPVDRSAQTAHAQTAIEPRETFEMRVVATGLGDPFQVVWGPDGYLWVTERTAARITRVRPSDGAKAVAIAMDGVFHGEDGNGLLGMTLDPGLLKGTENDFVYVVHTYQAGTNVRPPVKRTKVVRLTYDPSSHTLGHPSDVLTNLPAGNDHQGGRVVFGPDRKLYVTIGDQGANQLSNFCNPNHAQHLPTAAQVRARDWSMYEGKILRLDLDGSIPSDNPTLADVKSHVYSYGHRNPQGLVFAPDGRLYESEHGPNTDDEINLIQAGKNYGWPNVAGYKDDQAYAYANWSASKEVPCRSLMYTAYPDIPPSVPVQKESEWSHPDFMPPLQTFHTVPTGFNFKDPRCAEDNLYFQCWPTVAPSSLAVYARRDGIPGWDHSLLMPSLKHGTVFRIQLNADGTAAVSNPDDHELFKTVNRYRDVAVRPDGLALFVATDVEGNSPTHDRSGRPTRKVQNSGSILEFRYTGPRESAEPRETGSPSGGGGAQSPPTSSNSPILPYTLVEWPTPPNSAAGPPGAWNFIQVTSVAVTTRGSILVLHRGAHPIMEFDSSGKLLRSWGDGMFSEGKVAAVPQAYWTGDKSHYSAVYGPAGCAACGAHMVRVDPHGNIWVVDAPGHVVYKLNPDGNEVMRLGTKGVSGTGPSHFNLPTDVAFAPNGDVYITDGYGSARIVRYTGDGKYVMQWGKRGKGPGEFGLPHNLVVDARGRVYVTDRDNQRIEVFDANGEFLSQWTGTGGVSGLALTKDQKIWTGGILRNLDGTVVGRLPGRGVEGGHGVTATDSGDVYIAQLSGVVQKFVKN